MVINKIKITIFHNKTIKNNTQLIIHYLYKIHKNNLILIIKINFNHNLIEIQLINIIMKIIIKCKINKCIIYQINFNFKMMKKILIIKINKLIIKIISCQISLTQCLSLNLINFNHIYNKYIHKVK